MTGFHIYDTTHRKTIHFRRDQVDDLARNADEGRDKLRNALGSSMYTMNQRSLNWTSYYNPKGQGTQGIETSQYLQEKKSIEMLLLEAIENSKEQTESCAVMCKRCGVARLLFIPANQCENTWNGMPQRVIAP